MGDWGYLPAWHISATAGNKGYVCCLWQKWEGGVTPEWQA